MNDGTKLTLRLVAHDRAGVERDVEIVTDRMTAGGEVVRAVMEQLDRIGDVEERSGAQRRAHDVGGDDSTRVWAYAPDAGRWVGGAAAVISAGMRQGDRLLVAFQPNGLLDNQPDAADTWELRLKVAEATLRFALTLGSYSVGRLAGECDVVVPDDGVSSRHLLLRVATDRVFVVDLGSKNGTWLEGRRLESQVPTRVGPDQQLEIGSTRLSFRRGGSLLGRSVGEEDSRTAGHVEFARSARLMQREATVLVDLRAPPMEPGTRGIPILASLAPIGVGLVMWYVTGIVLMLLFSLLAPIVAGATIFEERRSGRQQFRRQADAFQAAVIRTSSQLRQGAQDDARARERELPGPSEILKRPRELASSLWERRPSDEDFLKVRIGMAEQQAGVSWSMAPGGSARLRAHAEDRLAKLQLVRAPVSIDLRSAKVVGIAGPNAPVAQLARWMIAQAVVYHSPAELALAAVVPSRITTDWDSLKWLPHARPMQADGPTAARLHGFVASEPGRARAILQHLASLASYGSQHRIVAARPVVALLALPADLDRALVEQVVRAASGTALSLICLAETRQALPSGVRTLIEVDVPGTARLTELGTGEVTPRIDADGMVPNQFRALTLAMAPLLDSGQQETAAAIPRTVQLVTLSGFDDLTAETTARRWA